MKERNELSQNHINCLYKKQQHDDCSRQNNTQINTPLQPSITTSIRSTTLPLSWSHMMPSVPLSPLSINQQTSISPSTGSRNNETPPSPDAQNSTSEQNTQEDTSGSAEELLEQVD